MLRSIRRRVLVSRLRSVLFIFLTLTFAAYSSTTVGAQVGGSLTGTIKDPSGGVVPGATVTVANSVLGTTFTATTDGQGLYSFPKLPVGRYDVTFAGLGRATPATADHVQATVRNSSGVAAYCKTLGWQNSANARDRSPTSEAAKFKPFAPVGGTMCAASPARKSLPNRMGSVTTLRSGAMLFSSDGPAARCAE